MATNSSALAARSRRVLFLMVSACLPVTWGCASLAHGGFQDIGIASRPTGAVVAVDDEPLGKTPIVARLARNRTHVITVSADGYQALQVRTTRSVNGWTWMNLFSPLWLGFMVDLSSGAMYTLEPNELIAVLRPSP
ncbi:MAG: PEGA domain-containing protein [Gemmatimonadales bacterium]